jgi:hypothetical protein
MKQPETIDQWGYRIAAETGYVGGNLQSLAWRSRHVRITKQTAARWARAARVHGMKLFIKTNRPTEPWATTSAGHTVTRTEDGGRFHAYSITSPAWDHPLAFRADTLTRALLTLEKHLGRLALYVDGVFADDEDPDTDMLDDADVNQLELFSGRMAA